MPRNSHLKWSVPYKAGKLEAVGYRNGKKLTAKVETTSEPYEVVVTPYKTTMLADGKDLAIINISVVDRQGRTIPDANHLIRFSLKGDANIIGVGNGDPSSHEPDKYFNDTAWQRKLFNGYCQVIIQAGKTKSTIKFEAKSEGLRSSGTDIYSIQPGEPHPVVAIYKANAEPKRVDRMIGADISF